MSESETMPFRSASVPLLRATGLAKSYFRGTKVPVLHDVNLTLHAGEFVSITGSSGSGKSTLLHLLGLLDTPDAGDIYWNGARLNPNRRRERDQHRNRNVGFVFQFYHLLPELSALENVMLPALIRQSFWGYRRARTETIRRAQELLDMVGLGHRVKHRPNELSGGELQRAAIARALVAEPRLLLADEPTGNLDAETGASIHRLLRSLGRDLGITVLMVTHDQSLAEAADRRLRLVQGRLSDPAALAAA
jgi:lipoprotein-releasing system ATP-binding protein